MLLPAICTPIHALTGAAAQHATILAGTMPASRVRIAPLAT
jgi:hypothetical protein